LLFKPVFYEPKTLSGRRNMQAALCNNSELKYVENMAERFFFSFLIRDWTIHKRQWVFGDS